MKTRSGLLPSLGLAALALIYRAILRGRYYGAEEEDYGNLGLIWGTLDSGFTYIETQHMPLFTSLAAAVTVPGPMKAAAMADHRRIDPSRVMAAACAARVRPAQWPLSRVHPLPPGLA